MDHTSGAAPRHTTGWPDGSNRSEEPPRLLLSPCEDLLGTMDDVYPLLVTIDYPDALTRSLRRNTDMLRSVPERTPRRPNPRPPPTPPRTTPLPPPRPSRPLRPLAQAPLPRRGGFQTRLSSPQNAARNSHVTKRNCDDRSPSFSALSCLLLPLLEVDIDSYRASRSGTGNEEELPECRIVE